MIYVDIVLLLNFVYDYLLLLTTGLILKREIYLKRIFIASLMGSLSVFLLFLSINNIILFILKMVIACVMVVVSFGLVDIKYLINNLVYLYMNSIILSGFMYYLSVEFNSVNTNCILLFVISPIVLLLYYKSIFLLKEKVSLVVNVKIVLLDDSTFSLMGYVDSGNKLFDFISGKHIIIINDGVCKFNNNPMYVPFCGVDKSGVLPCYKIKYLEIGDKFYYNYLVGVSSSEISIDGIGCILNSKLMEDLNV